jgi:hypothetical protein
MVLVGVVYTLLLRQTWNPQGVRKLADVLVHDAMPLAMLLFWLLRPHGRLGRADIAASMALPLGYVAYAMARGAWDGWYAYPFLDVARIGWMHAAINCAGIGAAFLALALLLAGLDRLVARAA